MNTNKRLSIMAISFAAILSLAACSDDKAEEAGETVDDMISNTKDAAKNTGDKIQKAVTDTGNAIEDACEDAKEKMDTEDTDC
ncbi:hypothetical protein Q4506_11805 [Colwellia sp. 4_MG-2023]|jgi:gas vesicle protein|uniref:hypothetical protein n=1 Tax=unclassified Colwellia TaxID=196834 RepID=UPI001C099CB2|nr:MULTISPECIES: hypothetical protein [unclassified Colwellia]MBU2926063.1 hypothetical protein [Colwellia sp. C2M11]MDO6507771.1 hypothetical protein [Colwellia sp. 5_MG-2023]MDO6556374.1 hypothetical protein [Colwellia sp. 4_MG-2023]MDO6653204.1 hypothetical protein [Colwellia sp. 3_MG-2023]MDO6666043.1 hypothetical protein [Colwellia sp. 2_MG-2023]